MSGHSKWSTIKRAKAVTDAKRGAIFTKLGNLITISAKERGSDPDTNFSLRMAMDKAKAVNMPKDNIDRAVKRGAGELAGEQIEELYYEGMGPVNTQFIVKCLTDNKNRSASTVRHNFSKSGGSLSPVMWNFEQKGVVLFIAAEADKDELELELIDAGADDIKLEGDNWTVFTEVADLQSVKTFLESKNIVTESAEMEYVAKEGKDLSEADKEKENNFIEQLEENEDVSDFYTNANL